MSGWLNLNESLSNLKGQITNFANNVLAENEEGTEATVSNYEELKNLYIQKEREIEDLKKVNEELHRCLRIPGSQNGEANDSNWDWTTPELMVAEESSKENVPYLKVIIKELESEKSDLINQLEQLDSENQQNLAELVGIREHLQEENSDLKEKCQQLKQKNKAIASREDKLKQELKELQKKIEESSNQLPSSENFNEKYESIVRNNQDLHLKLEETTKELTVLRSTHKTLEKTLKDTKINVEKELAELAEKLKKSEMENKIIYNELQKAKEHVTLSEQKIQEDAENCQKLAFILESYEKQVSSLKQELDSVKSKRNQDKAYQKKLEALEKINQDLQGELNQAFEKVDCLENKDNKLKIDFEETTSKLKRESIDLRTQLEEKTKEVAVLQQEKENLHNNAKEILTGTQLKEIEKLNERLKQMSLEKESLHKMYVNIITDNVKRYIDSALVASVQYESEDTHVLEFSKQVEDIFKILLEYKQKCEIFEKQVLQVSQEKTQLLNEKNSEIEKLIQNSEILSQDVINKAETIKELETEITNLMTSNDVLMSELDSYKNSGLQTISESNEDNMLLLETDLDNANKRISELEKIIDSGEKITIPNDFRSLEAKVGGKLEDYQKLLNNFNDLKTDYDAVRNEMDEKCDLLNVKQCENGNLKSQLEKMKADYDNALAFHHTSLEAKASGKLEDYQQLLNSFDNLKIDYDAVKNELDEKCDLLNLTEYENENLKLQLEKIKADFENTDYQLSEANFSIDGLREELETIRSKGDALLNENKELKVHNMNSIDMKSELNEIKEKWLTEENLRREFESQVKGFKEKLQNSKVAETSLKLQYDTLSKEHSATLEAKNSLEQKVNSANESIAEYEHNYTELLQKYDGILLRCEEFNTKLHEKDNEVLKLQNEFKVVEGQKHELEKVLEENILQLQQHLHHQEVINEDLSSAVKLRKQFQEQEIEVMRLTSLLKNQEIKKMELEKLAEKQAREIQELTTYDISSKEALNTFEKQLRLTNEEIVSLKSDLKESQEENRSFQKLLSKDIKDFSQQTQGQEIETPMIDSTLSAKNEELRLLLKEKQQLQEKISNFQTELSHSQESILMLQQQLQELASSRNELINMITVKHQESLNYHNEIQRLSQILKCETEKYVQLEAQLVQASNASQEVAKMSEENDRLIDQNNFLKEKCDLLAKNLLEEQAKFQQALSEKAGPSEKELSLSKQLERLQSHLMELEEHYTQELLQAEQKNAELQTKVLGLEQREKNSSNMYTSVSIRANQQVETLQNQLQLVTTQRDELRKKISDAEDANSKQAAALTNLQFVLEQFQKDKEKDVLKETERIRRQINVEKQVQDNLRKEIENLKEQLEESKIGLQAASRLSDQLEMVKKQNTGLKEEVLQLQQKLTRSQETIHNLTSQTDGKIDKSLIKNLIVGLLSSGNTHNWNKDQTQIIKIIATVLDFNQQDHDKVKLNQPQQGSWLGSILFPQPSNQNMSQESLSQAFVKFLENESKPRVVPSLLSEQSSRPSTSTESSRRTTPRASPIVLNEIVLPTFADFGQSRNSSSILKDVLKDNNNS